jgi:phage-related protein
MSDLTYKPGHSILHKNRRPLAVVYRIDDDAIVIWEVFAKKDRTTPRPVIDTCKKRIKDYDAL